MKKNKRLAWAALAAGLWLPGMAAADCNDLANDFAAWSVCKGDCDGASSNHAVWSACRGNCDGLSSNYGAWSACRGDCDGLASNSDAWNACKSCGGGPRWAALYALGYTMRCR